jgi:hypothetical protein
MKEWMREHSPQIGDRFPDKVLRRVKKSFSCQCDPLSKVQILTNALFIGEHNPYEIVSQAQPEGLVSNYIFIMNFYASYFDIFKESELNKLFKSFICGSDSPFSWDSGKQFLSLRSV